MKRAWIRSTLFNVIFILFNAVCCIVYLPTLLLPRPLYLKFIDFYLVMIETLERVFLNLKHEVRGARHLPQDGAYLVAAKHMSTYETFKLHRLFKDPSIILKKELLRIPLWGGFLKKTDVIAIDRSTPDKANSSIRDGALRMQAQGRPVVIFPQGTRVWPHESPQDKRYKAGIHRMQEATGLPVIPMATNSGMFWPRSGWLKSSGTVVFEFLKPIPPGLDKETFMAKLEKQLEENSLSLMNEAKLDNLEKKRSFLPVLLLIALLFGGYSYLWFKTAEQVELAYTGFASELGRSTFIEQPRISGFPGPIKLDVLQETFRTRDGELDIKVIHAQGWPIPFTPVSIITGPVTIQSVAWPAPIEFEGMTAEVTAWDNIIKVHSSELKRGDFSARLSGEIDTKQKPIPEMNLVLEMENHPPFIMEMAAQKIIKTQMALFLTAGFSALMDEDGIVRVPITQRERQLYAGPLPIATLPTTQSSRLIEPAESLPELPPLEPYNQLGPDQ